MRRIAEPIITNELCSYGCGKVARYKNGRGNIMCCKSSNSCEANKNKVSLGVAKAYESGKLSAKERYNSLNNETKAKMNWHKGDYSNVDFSLNGKGNHKKALIQERGHICESCNLSIWLGKEITLELEHVDGNNCNHEKQNLKLLCPNCHSQTDTWKGKNSEKKKKMQYVTDEEFKIAIKETSNIRQALLKLGLTAKASNYERAYRLKYEDLSTGFNDTGTPEVDL